MDTTALIKRHIDKMKLNEMFTTRDMLNYGRRATIDCIMHNLVVTGEIIRLAWGLFVKAGSNVEELTPEMVASKKAQAFNKGIINSSAAAARHVGCDDIADTPKSPQSAH